MNLFGSKSVLNSYLQYANNNRKWGEKEFFMKDILFNYHIILPHCISASSPEIMLPYNHRKRNRKDREKALAFLACVRLHQQELLDDHLRPLHKPCLHQKCILPQSIVFDRKFSQIQHLVEDLKLKRPSLTGEDFMIEKVPNFVLPNKTITCWRYTIEQCGNEFDKYDSWFNPQRRKLAILSFQEIPFIDIFSFDHKDVGEIICSAKDTQKLEYPIEQMDIYRNFTRILVHERMTKKLDHDALDFEDYCVSSDTRPASYFIVCVNAEGHIDNNYP